MADVKKRTWEEKLAEMRDVLGTMVDKLNKDGDYAGALAVQEALQKVAALDDKIGDDMHPRGPLPFVSDRVWP